MEKLKKIQQKEITIIICILIIIEIVLVFCLLGIIKKEMEFKNLKHNTLKYSVSKETKSIYNILDKKLNNKYDIKFNKLISYPLLECTFDTEEIENTDNDIEAKKLNNILKYIDSKDTKKEDKKVSYSLVRFNKRSIEEMYSNRDCDKNLNCEFEENNNDSNDRKSNNNDYRKLSFDFNKIIGKKKQYVNNKKKISVYILDKKYEKELSKIEYYLEGQKESSNSNNRFKNIDKLFVYEYNKKFFVEASKNNQIIYIVAEKISKNELVKMIKNIDSLNT